MRTALTGVVIDGARTHLLGCVSHVVRAFVKPLHVVLKPSGVLDVNVILIVGRLHVSELDDEELFGGIPLRFENRHENTVGHHVFVYDHSRISSGTH